MTVGQVTELRVAITVDDFDAAVAFYRDSVGLELMADWTSPDGRVVALAAGRATLELVDRNQAAFIDSVEVGRRVSGPVRLALEVPDSASAVAELARAGATVVAEPRTTPWGDRNTRLADPEGMQLTLFTVVQ
ncbi:MAG: VOC family protein [Thermocrispum sp.]